VRQRIIHVGHSGNRSGVVAIWRRG
jgi:hypothetical protein